MANEIYDSTWWGNTIDTASSIGTSTEMIQGQFNMLTSNQPNLVVNGDFSNGSTGWGFDSGWSVVNNQATTLGVSLTPIWQSALVNGTNRITFDVIDGGALVYTNYPNFSLKATFSTVGTHTIDLLSDGVGINQILYIYNNGAGNGATIDNVSVQLVRATTVEASKCLADAIHRIGIQDIQN